VTVVVSETATNRVAKRVRLQRARRALALVAIGLALLVGCTSTVHPPVDPGPQPVSVWLIRDARHRGLVLPTADGGLVEYGYGEFAWYAEMRDAWYRAFPAALWPTAGTLGVRRLAARDGTTLRRELGGAQFDELRVARSAAAALEERLARRFEAGGPALGNAVYGFDFVPDPAGYWCLFNCNDAVALWLTELGCQVTWVPVRLDLEVVPHAR
jgi:hypothetical protein